MGATGNQCVLPGVDQCGKRRRPFGSRRAGLPGRAPSNGGDGSTVPTAWAASVRGMAWHTGGSGDLHAERVLGERALGERVKTGGPVLEAPPEPRSTSPLHPRRAPPYLPPVPRPARLWSIRPLGGRCFRKSGPKRNRHSIRSAGFFDLKAAAATRRCVCWWPAGNYIALNSPDGIWPARSASAAWARTAARSAVDL